MGMKFVSYFQIQDHSAYIISKVLGYIWFLKSNRKKNIKKNDFFIFGFIMKNVNES